MKPAAGGKITIMKIGPYRVTGGLPLKKVIIISDEEGTGVEWRQAGTYPQKETYILCRCGHSKTMPYCDGTHAKIHFDGTETASRAPYAEQATSYPGPGLVLDDAIKLCAMARFCYRDGDTWTLTEERSGDPRARATAIQETFDCPSGRLVARDKTTGKTIETEFEPSISVVEDPYKKVSGPLWVKGGVPVESADGTVYEIRNRVTLCRCGKSKNMPFCDASHISAGFNDGDPSVGREEPAERPVAVPPKPHTAGKKGHA
jgi:CDGSH-type Zn-finger protein